MNVVLRKYRDKLFNDKPEKFATDLSGMVARIIRIIVFTFCTINMPLASAQISDSLLLEKADLVYEGAFRLPSGGTDNAVFAYGGTAVTYNPNRNSLFLVGHIYGQLAAEVAIPDLVVSDNLDDLNTATILQDFADPTEGNRDEVNPSDPNRQIIGGLLIQNEDLIISVYSYYDGSGSQRASHFKRPSDLSASGQVSGPSKIGDTYPGWVSGYMAAIPADWQSAFGAPALTGNFGLAIAGLQSWGPAVSVFNPDEIGQMNPVPATLLVGYSAGNSILGGGWDVTNTFYNGSSRGTGLVFINGSRSVLFFGSQGHGEWCYGTGEECGDLADSSKGTHAYPYKYQVWAYDANDLVDVRNGRTSPDTVKPYSIWTFNIPFEDDDLHDTGGIAYDEDRDLIYFLQRDGDGRLPLVHAFRINRGNRPMSPLDLRIE